MKLIDAIVQFVEDIELETVLVYCDTYQVPHDEEQWLDDDYPDKEDALRVALIDAMEKAVAK